MPTVKKLKVMPDHHAWSEIIYNQHFHSQTLSLFKELLMLENESNILLMRIFRNQFEIMQIDIRTKA
ncbi:CLUMA_CG003908, isoform A [Clunio marinus]|uniref:CLUMA_CG003908, isoform A n=1 Tax=Clunio marinus TaxID=568069 RepID=A0A1J1HRP0_9DIPT|nr:CLUMA_CG003908, isoform A [Clunio marinus]